MSSLLVSDIIKMAETQLKEAGIESGKTEAEQLYCYLKRVDRARFFLEWSEVADDRTCEQFFDLVARRAKREPLQYIIGSQEFLGLKFKVDPQVLIPRLDTETVVLAAELKFKEIKGKSILDLCCGTGVIGITLGKRLGAKVTAVDINPVAKKLAKENGENLGVKLDVLEGNLFEPVRKKKYNMIVSNPPYIKSSIIPTLMPEVKDFEPMDALDGGEDGLKFYKEIIGGAPLYLKKSGVLVLEIGHDQGPAVVELLRSIGQFTDIQVLNDIGGNPRVVISKLAGNQK